MEAISLLHALPNTKEQIDDFTQKVKSAMLNGRNDPIYEAIYIASIQKVAENLRKDPEIQEHVLNELMKYEKGTRKMDKITVEVCETGVKYDYQGDYVLEDLEHKLKIIQDQIKSRQNVLKNLDKSYFDDEGIEVKPAVKSSTTNYKVTIR